MPSDLAPAATWAAPRFAPLARMLVGFAARRGGIGRDSVRASRGTYVLAESRCSGVSGELRSAETCGLLNSLWFPFRASIR